MSDSGHLLQGPSGADGRPGATPGEAGHERHGGPEPVPGTHLSRNRSAAGAAAAEPAQSPGSCCWRRKGRETHLSESRAAASPPAHRAGPWGADSPGRAGKTGPGRAPGFSSPSAAAALISLLFCFCHTQEGGRVTCPCLQGEGAAQLPASAPAPHPHCPHPHTRGVWVAVPTPELLPAHIRVHLPWATAERLGWEVRWLSPFRENRQEDYGGSWGPDICQAFSFSSFSPRPPEMGCVNPCPPSH